MHAKRICAAGLMGALLAASAAISDPPVKEKEALTAEQEEALYAAIRRLGDESPEEREAAARELERAGTRALDLLWEARDAGATPDAEAWAKLAEIVKGLEGEARIEKLVTGTTVQALAGFMRARKCPACASDAWTLRRRPNDAFEKLAPRCLALTLEWTCCGESKPETLIVCREPDFVHPIVNVSSFKVLRGWMDTVASGEEAAEAARALLALSPPVSGGTRPAGAIRVDVTGDAEKGWACESREAEHRVVVHFSAKGAFGGIVIYRAGR